MRQLRYRAGRNFLKQRMYKNLTIYYFSGTGNTLTACRWITENEQKRGLKTNLIPIDRFNKIIPPPAEGRRLIGFCYPTHGFNLPWIMLKFILKFPRMPRCDVFLLNSMGGVSGIAQILPALILLIKGFRVKGMFPLYMPSNWISVHPGLSEAVVSRMFARSRGKLDKFCKKIFAGKIYLRPIVFIMLPLDIALAPIAFMYFMYGRFYFAKVFIAATDCDTCRLCETKCPTTSIRIIDNRPFWKLTCESCMRCINICPQKAIQVSHSLAVLIPIISSFVPVALALNYFHAFIPAMLIKPADFFIKWGITLSMFFIISGLVFWLIRIKPINKLFAFTSLTKYWRLYIAPGIKAKDF